MHVTDLLDRLNRHIRFGPSGEVLKVDRVAADADLDAAGETPLTAEIRRCLDRKDFSDNRLIALSDYQSGQGDMAALMTTPYLRDAQDRRVICFQGFSFVDAPSPEALHALYPAPDARPVTLTRATAGIRGALRFVAFFPDSLIGVIPAEYHHGFYFREKFVEAFEQCIRPLLQRLWDLDSFVALRAASPQELSLAAATWVHLHEHFHSTALLPIDRYTRLKDSRLAGAFEELRVDLAAMTAPTEQALGEHQAQILAEFILAFRLIYYGSSFDPARDYDAITSVALSNLLTEAGCLNMTPACQYAFSSAQGLRAGLMGGLSRLTRTEERIAASLLQSGADHAAQIALRPELEATMRQICQAGANGVSRGAFHDAHQDAGATETA